MVCRTLHDSRGLIPNGHPDPVGLMVKDHHRIIPVACEITNVLHATVVMVNNGSHM
jgi:hypothetical protein